MSMLTNRPLSLGFQPLGYVLFYGIGAFLITVLSLDGANAIGVLATATFVYFGAALFGLAATLYTEPKSLAPNRREFCDILLPVAILSGSGALFWYVSLEVSILAVTAAFPLKVVIERQVASWFFRTQDVAGATADRLKARRGIDVVMAVLLLILGLSASEGSEAFTPEVLGLIALLVAGGVAAELSMVWLQKRSTSDDRRPLAPARQVAYVNLALSLVFIAIAALSGNGQAVLDTASLWQMPAFLAVGVLGVAMPTILRLGLVRKDVHPAEISVLAFGFPGATYVVKILAVAISMIVGMFTDNVTAISVLQSSGSLGVFDLVATVLILIFVVDRLHSDYREGGPGDSPSGTRDDATMSEDDMPERPRSLQLDSATDAKSDEWSAYLATETAFLERGSQESLADMEVARKALGLDAYRALPPRLLPAAAAPADMLIALRRYAELRHAMLQGTLDDVGSMAEAARLLHKAEFVLLGHKHRLGGLQFRRLKAAFRLNLLLAAEKMARVISRDSKPLADGLAKVTGKTGLERWAHRTAWTLRQFFSYHALLHTGFETSWGFRFIIPGTGGIGANAGAWVMLYSGNIRDHLAQAVPMRINPGFTFATAVFVWTINRPGVGYGPSLPWGNAYVDAQRYKLLLGFDGVGYVRTGEWRARGPYTTVSGSLPFLPLVRITWNASIFSPGFVSLVRWSTPMAERLQAQAETLTRRVSGRWFG